MFLFKQMTLTLSTAFGITLMAISLANAACISGSAKLNVFGVEEGEQPDEADVLKTKKMARDKAWAAYTNTLEAKYLKAYMRNKSKIYSELKYYVIKQDYKWTYDEGETEIQGTNCITVDFGRLKASLKVEEAPAAIKSGEGSVFVTLFIARQAASAATFAAVKERNNQSTKGTSTASKSKSKSKSAEKQKARASGGSAISISKQKSNSKSKSKRSSTVAASSRSSGSTTRRSDEITYKIISAKAVDGTLSEKLTKAGYESYMYKDVAAECDGVSQTKLAKTFETAEELTGPQRRSAFRAAKKCEVRYFALGTMTADIARTHDSGMKMVTVRVQGEVFDIKRRLPRRVVTIPPEQFMALGMSEDAARTDALKKAGKAAGQRITKIMQEKGLK
jgi:hypothetical protein